MENILLRIIDKKDFNEHPILYKYRDWNDVRHHKLLSDPSVYFPPHTEFKDPLDCKIRVPYEKLSDTEIFEYFLGESFKVHPDYEYFQHCNWACERFQNGPLRDRKHLYETEIDTSKEFNERFGVLCLTTDQLNINMWDEYANHKKGFCVGFDSKRLLEYMGGSVVRYVDDLPAIKPLEDHRIQFYKKVFFKESKYSFEKEYRMYKFWSQIPSNRNVKIEKECILEIIFGPDIIPKDKFEIESYVRLHLPHVKLIETKFDGNKIQFCD